MFLRFPLSTILLFFLLVEEVLAVSGSITRGEKTAIIPPNYKIRVRQLLPLPRSDAVKNTQNMFTREDYVDVTDNEIYNKYVDFVNRAVNDKNTKDISVNYS